MLYSIPDVIVVRKGNEGVLYMKVLYEQGQATLYQ